jgi:hypothetical protein
MNVARSFPAPRTLPSLALVVLALSGTSVCNASTITYNWIGDNGFSGYFSVDQSAFSSTSIFDPIFGGSQEYQFISDSYVTALFITDGIVTFDTGDIVSTSGIWFNSLLQPPDYADGAGFTAIDALDDELSFNGSGLYVVAGGGGGYVASDGTFTGVIIPEPDTMALLSAGLVGLAYCVWRKARRPSG